jgi:hypothetical protein
LRRRPDHRVARSRRDRRSRHARVAATSLAIVAAFALCAARRAEAQGVSFSSPGRVPREHDSSIGSATTSDPHLDYVLHCQGCHQAEGQGLAGSVPQLKDSVAHLVSMPGGREYLSRVPGVAQSQLDDAAVALLLNWLLEYFDAAHLPDDFRPFTAQEIAPLRRRPLVEASKARAALFHAAATKPAPLPAASPADASGSAAD